MSVSSFASNDGTSADYDRLRNLNIALMMSRPQTAGSAFEWGLTFERRGGSWFSGFAADGTYREDTGFERKLDLAYLSLPIRIRAGLPSGRVVPTLHAGLEGGYLLWARETTTDRDSGARYSVDRGIRDHLRAWELSAAIGGRLSTPVAGRHAFVELTYVHGLSSVDPGTFRIEGSLPSIANRTYRLCLGISM